jgi:hypothetical protein
MPIIVPTAEDIRQRNDEKRKARNESKKATRHVMRSFRRAEHDVSFISVDGEGERVRCYKCDCPESTSKNDADYCECGHKVSQHEHAYVLIGIGQQQIERKQGLTFNEIMMFLYSEFRRYPDAVFVGYYLNYDFTQWLKKLPRDRARMLFSDQDECRECGCDSLASIDGICTCGHQKTDHILGKSGRRPHTPGRPLFPVRFMGWEFDILGHKRFKLRPEGSKGNGTWMYVCDGGPFFQSSFMKAINPREWDKPIVTDQEWAILQEGKGKRDKATLDDDMHQYNRLENDVLSRLMERLNEGFVKLGIYLKKNQWFGPGQCAQAWLNSQNVPTTKQLAECVPWQVLHDAESTYYGGWFEIFMHGHLPGVTYEYDINSAYPYHASTVPCLEHGTWEYRTRSGKKVIYKAAEQTDDSLDEWLSQRYLTTVKPVHRLPVVREGQLRIVYAEVTGSDKYIGTMLHRLACDEQSICRPDRTRGYYWQDELQAAINAGLIDTLEVSEWWTYTPCDCLPPLQGLRELYEYRKSVGKNSAHGKSAKLVYNSIYGKFAQTIGVPKYRNMIYASRITSGCRKQILEAIASHPEGTKAVAMIATDGIYFTSPHPSLPLSKELGDWECAEKKNLTLFKPGVYWDDRARERIALGQDAVFKSRGVNAAAFGRYIPQVDEKFKAWNGQYPQTKDDWPAQNFITGFSMITCPQALQWGKWFLAGNVSSDKENTQSSYPHDPKTGKRSQGYYDTDTAIYRSRPRKLLPDKGGYYEASVPYGPGMAVSETRDGEDTNPDGSPSMILAEVLGMKN